MFQRPKLRWARSVDRASASGSAIWRLAPCPRQLWGSRVRWRDPEPLVGQAQHLRRTAPSHPQLPLQEDKVSG